MRPDFAFAGNRSSQRRCACIAITARCSAGDNGLRGGVVACAGGGGAPAGAGPVGFAGSPGTGLSSGSPVVGFSGSSGAMTLFGDISSSTLSFTRSWQAWRLFSARRRRSWFRLGKMPNASKKRSSRARAYALPDRKRPFARSIRYGRSGCGLPGTSEKT